MSPQQRFEQQQADTDRITGTVRPAPRFTPGVKVDEATYEKMTFSEKIEYAESFQAKAATNPDGSPAEPAAAADDLNGPRVKVGDAEFTEKEIRDALADKAAREANKASLPAKPEDYKFDLPADLKLPEGVSFAFNLKDPLKGPILANAQAWAKANELTQVQFSGLLGLYAASQSHEAKLIADATKAEREKLGPAGVVRVDAVSKWLQAMVGDKSAGAMVRTIFTADQVDGFERIIQRFTSQGGASFRTTGREAPEAEGRLPAGKEGEKIWNGWSYTRQKEYSERFERTLTLGGTNVNFDRDNQHTGCE